MSPSLKNIPVSVPPTCARSSTCETAENCPRKPNCVSRSCTNGLLTTTSASAAGRVSAELRLTPGEYRRHAPTRVIPARPTATHSFGHARPLVRRPMRSARPSDASSVSIAISLVLPIYCSCYLHNLNQKKSTRLFPDLTNQTGQGHLRQRALEAVLSLRKNLRHAFLKVTAHQTSLVYWIRMNRKRRRCCTGTIYVQERDLSGRTRKHARSALSPPCYDQARFRKLRERLSNEGRVGVQTVRQGRRRDFLAVVVSQGSHNVRGNRKLDAFC